MRYIGYLFFQATSSMHIKSINTSQSNQALNRTQNIIRSLRKNVCVQIKGFW